MKGSATANPFVVMMSARLTELDDATLVEMHLDGQPGAFEELYGRFYPRLVGFCRGVLHSNEAEDIAQEAFLRGLVEPGRFDHTRTLCPWLCTIARNVSADRMRSRSREVALNRDHEESLHVSPIDSMLERTAITEAMAVLTPQQRRAMGLYYLDDWTSSEAADFLDLSRPAFKQLVFRARRAFRTEYRRLLDGAAAVLVIPARVISRIAHRLGDRMRRRASRAGLTAVPTEPTHQLLAAAVSLALVVGQSTHRPASNDGPGRPDAVIIGATDGATHANVGSGPPPTPTSEPSNPTAVPVAGHPSPKTYKPPDVPPEEAAGDIVEDLRNPNAQTEQPEDSHMLAAAFSPTNDKEVFASGEGRCNATLCHPVLFRSPDGGRTWERLPAEGFAAGSILLPPTRGSSDERIFAMGRTGLQSSEDGGQSFRDVAPAGAQSTGSAAISPLFGAGDPTILIGARALYRYRDDTRAVEPVATNAVPGPFEPAFSSRFASDRTVFLGGVAVDPEWGTPASTVYRCIDYVCSSTSLEGQELTPRVRTGVDHSGGLIVYAFTQWAVFRSTDGGQTFEPLPTAWPNAILTDLAVGPVGKLYAGVAATAEGAEGRLYVSADEGVSWLASESPLFANGIRSLAVTGDRVIAALMGTGLACSGDGGLTWAPRCQD